MSYYEAFDELAKEGKLTVRYRGSWFINPNVEDFTVTDQIDHGFELSKRFKAGGCIDCRQGRQYAKF